MLYNITTISKGKVFLHISFFMFGASQNELISLHDDHDVVEQKQHSNDQGIVQDHHMIRFRKSKNIESML